MQIVENLLDTRLDIEPKAQVRRKHLVPPSKTKWFICLSISLHIFVLIIIGLSYLQTYSHKPIVSKKNTDQAISSYFVFAKAAVDQDVTPELSPETMQQPTVSLSESVPKLEPKLNDIVNSEHALEQALKPIDSAITQENTAKILTSTSNSQADISINMASIDQALQNYQIQLNDQQINKMAQESALAFRKEKTSPQITMPSNTMTPEQQEALRRRVVVDCTNAAKRGLSIITSLLGGTIECNQNPDFQEFIDKRINKAPQDPKQ
jgi:hypothetical protein